ncbi:hypothetical protein HHI36_007920 [Cryptolaemus montrouzieri]|uniref:Uncharacterized protein n=1 Tax=Cryptolaemus montrouzieri TaxID=559131 RepID=A0ABD2MRU8_9CUCU
MGSKVTAVAVKKSKAAPLEKIMTPSGPQQIIQKTITEKRVERSKRGEIVFRNIKTIEVDPSTGDIIQVEEEVQKLNPDFPAPKGPVKEIVTIVSENDITASYETRRENRVQETIKLDPDMGMDLRQVSQLVDEEKEDVHNILQYLPPDLDNQSPEMYPLKKRLQALRLTSENISSLEKSVINPPPSADEPLAEASPELMAIVMNTAEKDAMPNAPPVQIFNSLFRAEPRDYPLLVVSSATPGPLGDVVVPITVPEVVHEDMLSQEMEEVSVIVQVGTVQPPTNGFSKSQPSRPKKRGRRKRQYTPLTEEDPPWDTDDLNVVMEALGARVNRSVHPTNVLETTQGGRLKSEIAKGIEYILDAEPLQYYSRVQLRGSQPPSWFPGYMVALTDMSNSVAIAKSPSQVLFSAWRSVQPDVFPDDSIVYN